MLLFDDDFEYNDNYIRARRGEEECTVQQPKYLNFDNRVKRKDQICVPLARFLNLHSALYFFTDYV